MAAKSNKSQFIKNFLQEFKKKNSSLEKIVEKKYIEGDNKFNSDFVDFTSPTSILIYGISDSPVFQKYFSNIFCKDTKPEELDNAKNIFASAKKSAKNSWLSSVDKKKCINNILNEISKIDDGSDYSELYNKLMSPSSGTSVSSATIGDLIKAVGEKTETNGDLTQNNSFSILFATALIAKSAIDMSGANVSLNNQIATIEKFLTPFLIQSISDGINKTYICDLTKNTLNSLKLDSSFVEKWNKSVSIKNQIHTKVINPSFWNCAFTGENSFIYYSVNGLEKSYFNTTDLNYTDEPIEDLLKSLFSKDASVKDVINKSKLYSIIQKVARAITDKSDVENISNLNKNDIVTILIATQNILGTLELDNKDKKSAIDEASLALAIPTTEVSSWLSSVDKYTIFEKVDKLMEDLNVNDSIKMTPEVKTETPYHYAFNVIKKILSSEYRKSSGETNKKLNKRFTQTNKDDALLKSERYCQMYNVFANYAKETKVTEAIGKGKSLDEIITKNRKIPNQIEKSIKLGVEYCLNATTIPEKGTPEAIDFENKAKDVVTAMTTEYGKSI